MANLTITEAYEIAETQRREDFKRVEKCFQERKREIDLTFQAAALLSGAGFEVPPFSTWGPWNGFTLMVKRDDLKRVHDVLGRLKLYNKGLVDGKKRTICISLKAVSFPTVSIEYITKLARTARCKIVTQRQKAYTYKTLVCET
jgi:hypothetical protein